MSTLMFLLSYLEEYRVQKYQTGIELSFYDNILTGGSGVSACDETYCDNQPIMLHHGEKYYQCCHNH